MKKVLKMKVKVSIQIKKMSSPLNFRKNLDLLLVSITKVWMQMFLFLKVVQILLFSWKSNKVTSRYLLVTLKKKIRFKFWKKTPQCRLNSHPLSKCQTFLLSIKMFPISKILMRNKWQGKVSKTRWFLRSGRIYSLKKLEINLVRMERVMK